ncbi:MAG: hypothetical protein IKT99_07510 [Oscillospiraceae bacterium]|nr:hypothetical protein [Oscillospiraceae bacterium]
MLKALVKKQFRELFQSYFQNKKTGKGRSRGGVVGMFILFVFIMLFLCLVFGVVAFGMGSVLLPQGLDWLYFSLMSLIALFLGVFGSVFNTYASLYTAKDNELLLAMPIPPSKLLASRLIGVYAMGLLYETAVLLPAIVVYWILTPVTPARILCPLGLLLALSLVILSLCCILGWVVALIASRLKNKSFITVFVSLAFLALYYVFYFKANAYLQQIAQHTDEISKAMQSWLYPFYQMGLAGAGNVLSLLIVALIAAALFAAVYLVLSRSFLRIATQNRGEKKAVYHEKTVKAASVRSALLRREFKHFTASATYMLNCALGTVLMLGAAVLVLIKAPALREGLGELYQAFPPLARLMPVIMVGLSFFIASMNDITAPSVSLEGRSLWLIQSLPVRSKDVLRSKQLLHLSVTLPVALLMMVCLCAVVRLPLVQSVLVCVICLLFVCLSSAGGLAINLLKPNLNWTNESVPIKQSTGVLIALFGGWVLAAILVVPYLFLGKLIAPELYLVIVAVLLGLAVLGLNLWINKRGAVIFENL